MSPAATHDVHRGALPFPRSLPECRNIELRTDPQDMLPSTDPAPACVEGDSDTACNCGSCLFARMPRAEYVLTPLARAALANGVSFDNVQAYVERLPERIPLFDATDALLDMALDDSAQAREPQRSRLWWQGVLS